MVTVGAFADNDLSAAKQDSFFNDYVFAILSFVPVHVKSIKNSLK